MIESGVTFDFGQLVMDNEIARMIKHCLGGITVDDETLAVDDIAAVGPFGDFLSLDATLLHMRELSQATVLDRRVREEWQAQGATELYQRCRARAIEIIEQHEPDPIDPDVARQMHAIVEAADREKGVA
jgi:trimethylamine--corrinoid protein Co-methyltransferase